MATDRPFLIRIRCWLQAEMPPLTWIRRVLVWIAGLLSAAALAVIIVDPCTRYREPLLYPPYFKNAHAQLPGIVRHFDYDTLVLGSSMAQNFSLSDFERLYGQRAIKGTAAGTRAADLREFLDFAHRSHPGTLENVCYCFDLWAFSVPADEYAHPVSHRVFYRYTYWRDYEYWWNWDVWRKYMLLPFKAVFRKNNKYTDKNMMFSWKHRRCDWGLDAIKCSLGDHRQHFSFSGNETMILDSFGKNLLPYVADHPEVAYKVIFPPYSLIFWWQLSNSGDMEIFLASKETVISTLLTFPNVEVYDFQVASEVITDYDLYKDITHYRPEVNTWMLEQIKGGAYRVSTESLACNSRLLRELCAEHADFLRQHGFR